MTVLDLFIYLDGLEQEDAAEAVRRRQDDPDAPPLPPRRRARG